MSNLPGYNSNRIRRSLIILSIIGTPLICRTHNNKTSRVREDECVYHSYSRRNELQMVLYEVVTFPLRHGVLYIDLAHEYGTCRNG